MKKLTWFGVILSFSVALLMATPQMTNAGTIMNGKVSLSPSKYSQVSTHTLSFNAATTGNLGGITLEYAVSPTSLLIPQGLDTTSSTQASVLLPFDDSFNWNRMNVANGRIVLSRVSDLAVSAGDKITITLPAIVNNVLRAGCNSMTSRSVAMCYVRVQMYSDTFLTVPTDSGVLYYLVTAR